MNTKRKIRRRPGRPSKRIRSDAYKVRCYTLGIQTIEALEGIVERGHRSKFVEDAIMAKLWIGESKQLANVQKAIDETLRIIL